MLSKIAKIKSNYKVYVVGGYVRDKILKKRPKGIDLVVEGDGIKFAKLLKRKIGGKLVIYEDFKTATIYFDNKKIDIATTRKEIYPEPAKLPVVHEANLLEDLNRRDFTINAIAMNIKTKEIIDVVGGIEDINKKIIKVLHKKSFIDDPTRIFRAIRFAGRLNFSIEDETEKNMIEAINNNMIEKLTPERIRKEIILILEEKNREKIIKMMDNYGILQRIGLKLPEKGLFRRISKQNGGWFSYLLGIIDTKKCTKFIAFNKKEIEKIKLVEKIKNSIEKIEKAKYPSECYELLNQIDDECLVFLTALCHKIKNKIEEFVKIYRNKKLKISGEDLKKLGIKPSPLYKKLLYNLLMAKIDNKVKDEDELNYIKKLLKSKYYL